MSVYLSLAPFYEGVLAEGTQSQTTLRIERRTLLPAVVGAQLSHFARVGEGFTSESEEHGIDAEYRMFSAPDFPEICGAAARPAKLVARNTPVTLRVGELYPLRRLVILAVDVSNKTVGPVPIAVDVESKDPALLDLRADSALADAMLLPVASGRFYLRARSLCPGTRAQVQFLAIVQER